MKSKECKVFLSRIDLPASLEVHRLHIKIKLLFNRIFLEREREREREREGENFH